MLFEVAPGSVYRDPGRLEFLDEITQFFHGGIGGDGKHFQIKFSLLLVVKINQLRRLLATMTAIRIEDEKNCVPGPDVVHRLGLEIDILHNQVSPGSSDHA